MWRVKLKGASPLGTHTLWLNPLYKRPGWIIGQLSYFCPAETSQVFFFPVWVPVLFRRGEQSLISLALEMRRVATKWDAPLMLFLNVRLCARFFFFFLSLSTLGLTDNSHGKQPWGGNKQQEWRHLLHWRWALPSSFGGKNTLHPLFSRRVWSRF